MKLSDLQTLLPQPKIEEIIEAITEPVEPAPTPKQLSCFDLIEQEFGERTIAIGARAIFSHQITAPRKIKKTFKKKERIAQGWCDVTQDWLPDIVKIVEVDEEVDEDFTVRAVCNDDTYDIVKFNNNLNKVEEVIKTSDYSTFLEDVKAYNLRFIAPAKIFPTPEKGCNWEEEERIHNLFNDKIRFLLSSRAVAEPTPAGTHYHDGFGWRRA